MPKLAILLILMGCSSQPIQRMSQTEEICVNHKPVAKPYVTFSTFQAIPNGLSLEEATGGLEYGNDYADAMTKQFFQTIAEKDDLPMPNIVPKHSFGSLSLKILRTSANDYIVCRDSCDGLINPVRGKEINYHYETEPNEVYAAFRRFFATHYFPDQFPKEEIFKKAVSINKKINGNWITEQANFDLSEVCKYARPKTDLITGN